MSSSRPRAVDFLDKEDGETREFENKSDEEPLIVSENEGSNSEQENEVESSGETEEIEQKETLPSGAISKGKFIPVNLSFFIYFVLDEEDFWSKKTRSGGAYIPPARLAMMQRSITDKSSEAFQRVTWEALKKSLNGLINKVNVSNLKDIVVELFGENLIRGRGLLVRACLKAQASALPFTPVYAALIAVLNTKLPDIGELTLKRLIVQFRRSYKRNDKTQCLASVMFLAHLVNQKVAHEIVALQLLTLLLEQVTEDGVEIAVAFMKECGSFLAENSPKPSNAIFERFRTILHEGNIDKRVQYMIEVLFQIRKDKFKDLPAIKEELDLVEIEEQTTHFFSLDDEEIDAEESLNVFKFDEEFLENEEIYNEIKREILGDDDEEEQEGLDETEGVPDATPAPTYTVQTAQEIADMTGTNLINLRKTIYLTIMSSVDFEECGHKLLKITLPTGLETELTNMLIECCSQERSYLKFYGLLGERFAKLNPIWSDAFLSSFATVYGNIHRLETNRIRNVAKFFGHMLSTDALPWSPALNGIQLTEEGTTSASRIFLKFLFQDLAEFFGCPKLLSRFYSTTDFEGIFPRSDAKNLRFSINFFTAIGLGPLTEPMREKLKEINMAGEVESEDESEDEVSDHDRERMSELERERDYYDRERERERGRDHYEKRLRSPPESIRSRNREERSPGFSRNYRDRSRSRNRSRSRSRSYRSRSRSRSNSRGRRY